MDDADRAEIRIEQDRQRSIDAVIHRPKEKQVVEDGEVLCTECWSPIPLQRLEALPNATRCVRCQDINEAFYA